ncbi:MAG: AAA family ATPase [Limisphaerales bacterium]
MKIISINTGKGGSGKSTVASNLLVAAHLAGKKVRGLDCDPQATLAEFAKLRKSAPPVALLPDGASAQLPAVVAQARAKGDEIVFLDTAGLNSHATTAAMLVADFVIVPIRPTRPDALAVRATVATLHRTEKPFAFLICQAPAGRTDPRANELAAGLGALGMVAPEIIHARAAYQDAFATGQGVQEFEPAGKAAGEIAALWTWLQKELSL